MPSRFAAHILATTLLLLSGGIGTRTYAQDAGSTAKTGFESLGLPTVGEDPAVPQEQTKIVEDDGAPPMLEGPPSVTPEKSASQVGKNQSGDTKRGGLKNFGFDDPAMGSIGSDVEGEFGFGGGFGGADFGGAGFGGAGFGVPVEYEATYELAKDSDRGRISVTAIMGAGYHTYSTTQPADGPTPTRIKLVDDFVELAGPFVPDHEPEIGENEAWPGVRVEEYHEEVTWTAPIRFRKPADESVQMSVQVDALVCQTACQPVSEKVSAKFAGYYMDVPQVESLRVSGTHAVWSAKVSPSQLKPGDSAVLQLTAATDPGYHVYEFVPNDPETLYRTLIVAKTKSGLQFGAPQTKVELKTIETGLDTPARFYKEPVTWSIPIKVPANAASGELPIELMVAFMTCNDTSCDPPSGVAFSGSVVVGASTVAKSETAFSVSEISDRLVADSPSLVTWIDVKGGASVSEPTQSLTLWHVLAGLAGGFILNFMPCVLPVIGLKIMSFVEQAGNSHRRVVTLNLAFVAGILAVMLTLALLTVGAKAIFGTAFGWGEQFTVLEFKVAMAALVFAMALSFLGVWEIPIPGFATTSKSGELMEKEGHTGAFAKGVLTTVLATPCSGPLLGSLFGLSLVLSPASVVMLYLIVGLGMSLPYLALCIYPDAIKLLPKPGAWMDTLKQVLAFPLLLTAVFFVASIDDGNRIATLILLIVVWFACWLIGRVPAYAEKSVSRKAWGIGLATVAVGALVSFGVFGPIKSDLPWEPYDEVRLAQLRRQGKTVMIDFTANWCLNCQINTRVAIEKKDVAQLVKQNEVVPMLADWTEPSDEIRRKLEELQSNSIPLMVIYPPDPNAEPIVLRDLLSESQVLKALEQAGPSLPKSQLTGTID